MLWPLPSSGVWASNEDPFRLKRVYCYANMGLEELKRRIEDPNY